MIKDPESGYGVKNGLIGGIVPQPKGENCSLIQNADIWDKLFDNVEVLTGRKGRCLSLFQNVGLWG